MRHTASPTVLLAAASVLLAACSSAPQGAPAATSAGSAQTTTAPASPATPQATTSTTDHGGMHHEMDGGPAPAGMTPAASPKFPVGSTVTLHADHMPGMEGAKATVVGVYDTTTYAVDYTPTTGGAPVKDHKWVVQEELDGVGSTPLTQGDTATMTADHMPGMKGAKATVAEVTTEPVYIVDYESGGMTMENHKWVVESEVKAG